MTYKTDILAFGAHPDDVEISTAGTILRYINEGKKVIEGSKNELLNIISTKSVAFVLNKNNNIPKELNEYKPVLSNGILKLSYDKNKTNIKKIIDILNINQIDLKEINTFESDLEDVFIKVVNKNNASG